MGASFSTDRELKALPLATEKAYKANDLACAGLYVLISKHSKVFRYDFRFENKRKTITLGAYQKALTLAQARDALKEVKATLAKGKDPQFLKMQAKKSQAEAEAQLRAEKEAEALTFAKVAAEWLPLVLTGRSESQAKKINNDLGKWLYPKIGLKPIANITQSDLIKIVKYCENEGLTKQPKELTNTIKRLFSFAMFRGYIEKDPAQGLEKILIKQEESGGYASCTKVEDLEKMLKTIDSNISDVKSSIYVKSALQVLIYLPLRSAELTRLTWEELDIEGKKIVISKDRYKTGKDFTFFLSNQAIDIFNKLEKLKLSRFVFTGSNIDAPISCQNFRAFLRKCGIDCETQSIHGFRKIFSTICNEAGAPFELIEKCLGHVTGNEVSMAYNKSSLDVPRQKLMQWYANCIDSIRNGQGMISLDVSKLYQN